MVQQVRAFEQEAHSVRVDRKEQRTSEPDRGKSFCLIAKIREKFLSFFGCRKILGSAENLTVCTTQCVLGSVYLCRALCCVYIWSPKFGRLLFIYIWPDTDQNIGLLIRQS